MIRELLVLSFYAVALLCQALGVVTLAFAAVVCGVLVALHGVAARQNAA